MRLDESKLNEKNPCAMKYAPSIVLLLHMIQQTPSQSKLQNHHRHKANTREGRFVRRANLPSASFFSAHALRLLCSAQQDAKKAAYKKKYEEGMANARNATHAYVIQ